MRLTPAVAAALVVAACSAPSGVSTRTPPTPPSSPDIRMRVTEHFYGVRGRTVPRIAESLENDGPIQGRERVLALTTWLVGWGGRSTMSSGPCSFHDLRVNVAVEVILPRLLDQERSSRSVRAHWRDFETAVWNHEQGHRALAYQAGATLLDSLRAVRAPSCEEAVQTASAVARTVLARYRAADRAYDRRTARGASQGAHWPPSPDGL